MKMSEKLIELRKEKGWSQEDFAEKLEVSRQAVSRWENETALPDAQNILRISKLFNVTADYLLNDDYEDRADTVRLESDSAEPQQTVKKKKMFRNTAALIFIIVLVAYATVLTVKLTSGSHSHPTLRRVIENEIEKTCTTEGSHDEVIYCTECGEEVLRTHITTGKPSHQFYNQKCIICGEDQKAKD